MSFNGLRVTETFEIKNCTRITYSEAETVLGKKSLEGTQGIIVRASKPGLQAGIIQDEAANVKPSAEGK
jgi:hypothetical protein